MRAGEHQLLGRARPGHALGQRLNHEPRQTNHPPAGAGLGRPEMQVAPRLGDDLDHLDRAALQVDPTPAQPGHLTDAQPAEGPEQDRRTGQRYPSPSDLPQPRPADVGYLSRLTRPDGDGTFILLTGIHAVGSHGIIDYLRRELADLYEQIDRQPFSTLIATEYDPGTRQLVRSERITPLYQHQEP
jgi:hypothetical protein